MERPNPERFESLFAETKLYLKCQMFCNFLYADNDKVSLHKGCVKKTEAADTFFLSINFIIFFNIQEKMHFLPCIFLMQNCADIVNECDFFTVKPFKSKF